MKRTLPARMLAHGDVVDVETALPSAIVCALPVLTAVAYDIARGSVAAYYPEANALVPAEPLSRPAQRDPVLQIRAGEGLARSIRSKLRVRRVPDDFQMTRAVSVVTTGRPLREILTGTDL